MDNEQADAIPEPIANEDDAVTGYDITYVLESMRAHDARPDDGRCLDCGETIVKGCSTFVYGDRLCGDCGSDRKVRL